MHKNKRLKEMHPNKNSIRIKWWDFVCLLPFFYLPKIVLLDYMIFFMNKTSVCTKTNKHHFEAISSGTPYYRFGDQTEVCLSVLANLFYMSLLHGFHYLRLLPGYLGSPSGDLPKPHTAFFPAHPGLLYSLVLSFIHFLKIYMNCPLCARH